MRTKKIIPGPEVVDHVRALRTLGKKIVLIQGVYDMLHIGHIRFLEKGKERGDVLIVGLDSDALTKKRKGNSRPIYPEDERAQTLLALECVDYVVLREIHDDLDYLAKQIFPDVLVISTSTNDFENYEQVMREKHKDFCKEIICLEPQATTSTSAKIAKIIQTGNIEMMQGMMDDLKSVFKKHGFEIKQEEV
jgi:D-beta-D-heptose 7-phosphate kinase/D-beta-D-heptose 1-phosphate adenosyltransferase